MEGVSGKNCRQKKNFEKTVQDHLWDCTTEQQMKPFSGEKKKSFSAFPWSWSNTQVFFRLKIEKILWRLRDFLPLSTSPNTPLFIWYSCNQANSLIKEDLVGKSNFFKPHLRVQAFNFWWQLGKISSDRNWRGEEIPPIQIFFERNRTFIFLLIVWTPEKNGEYFVFWYLAIKKVWKEGKGDLLSSSEREKFAINFPQSH